VGVADAALYAAKAHGRDTFVTHTNTERATAGARRVRLKPPPVTPPQRQSISMSKAPGQE
jgi:hypothetical protein